MSFACALCTMLQSDDTFSLLNCHEFSKSPSVQVYVRKPRDGIGAEHTCPVSSVCRDRLESCFDFGRWWQPHNHLPGAETMRLCCSVAISSSAMIWVWVNTHRYVFSGMNIHLPAILRFTRYQGFDPSPIEKLCKRMQKDAKGMSRVS